MKDVTIRQGAVSARIEILGAQLVSLQKNGQEYIWQRDPVFWEDCAPVLFPVVGRPKDGILTINGKDYPMGLHGFVQYNDLTVTAQTENSVTLELLDNAETLQAYPWRFRFQVTYTIEGNRLTSAFRVENRDETEMIFGLGGHPGFRVPMEEGEAFDDYCLEFEKEEPLWSNWVYMEGDFGISAQKKYPVLTQGRVLPINRALFDNEAVIFEEIQSRWVNLVHQKTGKGIHFAYPDFPTLAIWSRTAPEESPYVCLEPWFGMGSRDDEGTDIEDKYGMQRLAPGGVFTAAFSMEILDGAAD